MADHNFYIFLMRTPYPACNAPKDASFSVAGERGCMAYALGRLRFFDNFHAIEEFGPSLLSGVRAGILAELEQKAWMD
jgi:hypothetical protein